MNATAAVAVESDADGATLLRRLRSSGPLALRATPTGVFIVGGAAGPLGGDRLALEVEVGPGARLDMRSVAASVALPGFGPSNLDIRARVDGGALLDWRPEPVVVAMGCDYRVSARVSLGSTARLVWREELVLGRHREPAGAMTSRLDVEIEGKSLLRQELRAGEGAPGWDGPAVGGGYRCVGSVVVVDPTWSAGAPGPFNLSPTAAVMALAGPAVQVVALADDARSLRALLDAGLAIVAAPTDEPVDDQATGSIPRSR